MPNFDHTGPEGKGSRTGRGMGHCMNRGANKRNAAQRGMDNTAEAAQAAEPGMGGAMGQNMGQNMGQGRCCRHGQRQNNRARTCGMNTQGAGMGQKMGRGMGQGKQQGACATNQPESCGTGPAMGSDGADNNS